MAAWVVIERPSVVPRRTFLSVVDCGGVVSAGLRNPTQIRRKFRESGLLRRSVDTAGPLPMPVSPTGAGDPVCRMLFAIQTAAGNTRGPVYTESLLRTVHRLLSRRQRLTLQLRGDRNGVGFGMDCPDSLRVPVLQELQDAYPGTTVRALPADAVTGESGIRKRGDREWSFAVRLNPDVLPLRTHTEFRDDTDIRQFADPVAGLLSAIRTGSSGRMDCRVDLVIRPAAVRRLREAERVTSTLNRLFAFDILKDWYVQHATSPSRWARGLSWMLARFTTPGPLVTAVTALKPADAVFECWLVVTVRAESNAAQIAGKKLREICGAFGRFNQGDAKLVAVRCDRRRCLKRRGFLLSAAEVASLWHPLVQMADGVSRLQTASFREVEPPVALLARKTSFGTTTLGRIHFRQQRNQFSIDMDDLRRHMLAIGKTGCGKSTFLLNVVRQQMEAGRGVVLVDPHGQLADEVLNVVPKRRTNDVICFDAADRVSPVGFNPMVGPPGTDATLVADGVLTSFKNVFGFDDGSAPRLLHIFRNCLLTLIGTPHASLSGVQRILVDAGFRKSLVAQVRNAAVREFWLTEFHRWNERDRTQYIASLQNKLGAFTTNERLQRILNPGQKGIQLRTIMDRSQILICNLSNGTVGHDASTLLGSLLLSSLQIAAMSRANVSESDRPDCVVVIDEFHSYLSDGNSTMADALAESRKYRTSYVLSTQMLEQLDHATLAGVLGNCGSTLCMTVGPRDAEVLAELLGSGLTPEDLMAIPKYHAYLRMLIAGAPHTFSMTTLPPQRTPSNRADIVKRASRQRYGTFTNSKAT
ncbi:MAG: ATP-binding protein [Planctomycetaceae bacterium]|nr:ATP-binding protein [Planctomycetaceae bacterium]